MPFRFRKASCVVAGTFNIYILHPQWLATQHIIERGTEVGFETNLARPGFRFHFPQHQTVWNVAPDRIIVESKATDTDCGEAVERVLRALPETPLFAVGNNVIYGADCREVSALQPAIRDFPQPEDLPGDETVAQQTFHFGVKRNDYEVVNLQLSLTEGDVELTCNAHTKLDDRELANGTAIATASRFFQDRELSEQFARHFFGAAIDHDTDND